jgi:hypothetical protein
VTETEIREHLEFLDGVQKAQLVVLRLLLREQTDMKTAIKQYAEQIEVHPPAADLTAIQVRSMKQHLLMLGE